jgi:hypothetical protein
MPAALKGDFLLPDLEDAIRQFDIELSFFGPNLQEVGCAARVPCGQTIFFTCAVMPDRVTS